MIDKSLILNPNIRNEQGRWNDKTRNFNRTYIFYPVKLIFQKGLEEGYNLEEIMSLIYGEVFDRYLDEVLSTRS